MKGLFKKISYMLVLMAVVLFLGMRSMPHHHCSIESGASAPIHAVHFGFGGCDDCAHEHDSEERHTHTEGPCFSEYHFFLRITDDSTFIAKKTYNIQPALILQEAEWLSNINFVVYNNSGPFFRLLCRIVPSNQLRAPPVACFV